MLRAQLYFLSNEYYQDFPDNNLMQNKDTIDGVPHTLNAGEAIIMPAGIPHAVQAVTAFKMYLVVVKTPSC